MNLPNGLEWLYSGKAFVAAMLAFYIALALDLPNPYWSIASVYIVSHPLSGATRSKSVYRALGTVIGAAMAVLLVPALASSPLSLMAAIGSWTGLSLYLSLLNRTPSSYIFLLASYTTPLIAIPAIMAPGSVFDIALARTEEILLGIICASVVITVIFPQRIATAFQARISKLLHDGSDWAATRLTELDHAAPPPMRVRLLNDVVAMDALIKQLRYDAASLRQADDAQQIRLRMTMLIPQVATLADALRVVIRRQRNLPTESAALLEQTIAWMREGLDATPAAAEPLRVAVTTQLQRDEYDLEKLDRALLKNALERLRELIDLWQDCLVLRQAFAQAQVRDVPSLSYRARTLSQEARHYDHGLMLFAAGSAAIATILTGWLWLYSGWPSGGGGVVMVAVAIAFFAASDNPAPLVGRFLLWEALSIVAAWIYLFAVLPHITTFAGVAAVMAPPLLLVGAFTGRPNLNMGVLLLTSQTISDIALRGTSAANFEAFVNSSLAIIFGLIFALLWTLLTHPFGAELAARRLARANWRDQSRLARRVDAQERIAQTARVLDRTSQWLPRLGLVSGDSLSNMDAVRDMRICLSLLDLQAWRERDSTAAPAIIDVLRRSRRYFDACHEADESLPAPQALIQAIDDTIAAMLEHDSAAAQALISYRLALSITPKVARTSPEGLYSPATDA